MRAEPTTIRLDPELLQKLRELAERERRTLSGQITFLIEVALAVRSQGYRNKRG